MAYNNNNKRFKRQEQDDNNLPQVFQRLGNSSRPNYNSRNNNSNRNQRYDGGGLRIARYNSPQRTFPDYGKIGQLSDDAVYYSPNNNSNDYTYNPPPITNPTSNFRFVRNDSQKDMSRPIISFLRDTPTSNGQISPSVQPPTQPAAHNNNDNKSNNNNSNLNHYNIHQMNNRRVINTEDDDDHQQQQQQQQQQRQNNEEFLGRRIEVEEEEDEEEDERTSYNNRINIEIAKKIQITASIPTSNIFSDNNSDTHSDSNSSNLNKPIMTSKRKVTLTEPEKEHNLSDEKRSRSNSSSNQSRRSSPTTSSHTRRSRSPSTRTKRSRSRSPRTKRNRSPSSPSRHSRRPRRSSAVVHDSDEDIPFMNLKGDTYVPRYANDDEKHINHRLSGIKKYKDLRSYPQLGQPPSSNPSAIMASHNKTWVKSRAAVNENNNPLSSSDKKFTGITNTTVNVTPNNTRNHSVYNNSSTNTSPVNNAHQKSIDSTKPTVMSPDTTSTATATATATATITLTKPDNKATTSTTTTAINTSVKPALTSVKPTSKTHANTSANASTSNTPVNMASNALTNNIPVKSVSFVVKKPTSKQKMIHNISPTKEEKAPTSVGTDTTTTIMAQFDKMMMFGLKEKAAAGSNMNENTTNLQSNDLLHLGDIRRIDDENNKKKKDDVAINNNNTTKLHSDASVKESTPTTTTTTTTITTTTVRKGIENQSNISTVIKNATTPSGPQQQDTIIIASNNDKSPCISQNNQAIIRPSMNDNSSAIQNVLSKKGENAKDLLRQLAIDERDDIVMDIVPLIRNTGGATITSPPILNHFHNSCKRSDIPMLKQEPLPDTTIIPEQEQDPIVDSITKTGLAQDKVGEFMSSPVTTTTENCLPEKNKIPTKLPEIDTQKAVLNFPPSPNDSHHQLISPPVSSSTETPPVSLPVPFIKPRLKTTQKSGRLPPPWKVRMNDSGDIFYLNTVTGEETSTRPV